MHLNESLQAAGIPVIASDFPLWREIVSAAGSGLLVDPMRPEAIAEAIESIVAHPGEAQAMGRAARKVVEERYNWAIEERKLLAFCTELLEQPYGKGIRNVSAPRRAARSVSDRCLLLGFLAGKPCGRRDDRSEPPRKGGSGRTRFEKNRCI